MKRQLTLGVLGHVDHGKTSLVRALTGTDTDRLKEEKARGMSIVPGFAYLEYPAGTVDIIDVPGHEDYVRAMIAGASGIDAALLVVDAREGVRRQTEEHVAIAELLGVRRGLVALTKVDLVPQAAETALRAYFARTFLREARMLRVSAHSGEGIPGLRGAIAELLETAEPPAIADGAFLPVDRVFSVAGHGTVVTGTLRRGALARGAALEVLPPGMRAIARQLQVHGRDAEVALPGQRVGINLRGLAAESVARGSVVATPGLMTPSTLMEVELASGPAPKPGRLLRVLMGTSESPARLRFPRGGSARLALERPLCALAGERFVLRDDAARRTLGGGRVLVPHAPRRALTEERLRVAERALRAFVEQFHARHPTRDGASLEACRDAVGDAALLEAALARLHGSVEAERGVVRRAGFDALGALPRGERERAEHIERAFLTGGTAPPRPEEVVGGDARREAVYRLLVARGRLIRIAGADGRPVVFHRDVVERARRELGAAYPPPAQFTVSQARERLRSTRRFIVPLLEFLDASRFTHRAGDLRSFVRQ